MNEPSLPDKVVGIHRAFVDADLPHAFGGALALAYYAVPRTTVDIDVNVFVPAERAAAVAAAMAPLGVPAVWAEDPAVVGQGQVRTWWGRNPVDLFFSYDAFHHAMAGAARSVPFGDLSIPVLAGPHLMACKAIFDRRKDWIDIEQMLLVTPTLDLDEARRWIERFAGAGDHRLERLDQVVAAVLGLPPNHFVDSN